MFFIPSKLILYDSKHVVKVTFNHFKITLKNQETNSFFNESLKLQDHENFLRTSLYLENPFGFFLAIKKLWSHTSMTFHLS